MADCLWCNRNFPPRARAGGSPQRFCCAAHRTAFWSALRRWGERAVAAGVLSIDQIRKGSVSACTLGGDGDTPPADVRAADPHPFRVPVAAPKCSGETAPDADLVPMRHPEGIGCSFGSISYHADQGGVVRVPAEAVPHLRAHGFVVVQADPEP